MLAPPRLLPRTQDLVRPERGRAGGGQELYRRGVAPLPSCGWLGPGFAHHAAEMAVRGIPG